MSTLNTIGSSSSSSIIRGSRLLSPDVVEAKSRELALREDSFPLGSKLHPARALNEGILFLGMMGVGKSLFINQILFDCIKRMGQGKGQRLFVWNHKGDAHQYLDCLQLPGPVYYLNPTDRRGVGINFAAELTSPLDADQFAAEVVSPEADPKGHNFGFTRAARTVFSEIIQYFQKTTPRRWRLIDVLHACLTMDNLQAVLSKTYLGQAFLKGLLNGDEQAASIFFDLNNTAKVMWPLASAMVHTKNISIKEVWIDNESVLVLPNVNEYRHALAPFQRWVFSRVIDLVLGQSRTETERFTFFLDEVRWSPFGDHLLRLATLGREMGAGMVVGVQDIEGLIDCLGPHRAKEFFGVCSTHIYMKTNNYDTQELVSRMLGQQIRREADYSESVSENRGSNVGSTWDEYELIEKYLKQKDAEVPSTPSSWGPVSHNSEARENYKRYGILPNDCPVQRSSNTSRTLNKAYKEIDRPTVLPCEVGSLSKAGMVPEQGLCIEALITSAFLGQWHEIATHMDDPGVTLHPDTTIAKFHQRPDEELYEGEWTESERRHYGLL